MKKVAGSCAASVPETLNIWGDPWESVDPVHNPMFLYEFRTRL